MFKFGLNQLVEITVSGEMGHIKGRAEHTSHINGYFVHYKAGDGRAVDSWFDESDLEASSCKEFPGSPVYVGGDSKCGQPMENLVRPALASAHAALDEFLAMHSDNPATLAFVEEHSHSLGKKLLLSLRHPGAQ